MVWIIEKEVFNTSAANSAAKKLCASAPSSSGSYNYYLNLKEKMLTALEVKSPSFSVSAKTNAETFELKWSKENSRYEVTLSDTNKVLSNYTVSVDGYKVSRNEDKLTFYTKNALTGTSVVTLTARNGIVKVTGNVLGGAVYGIYKDKGCTSLVEKLTTDQKGYVKSSFLNVGTYYVKEIKGLPLGKYYLTEIKTADSYVLDSEPIHFELAYKNQDTEVIYAGIDVENVKEKVKIRIVKSDVETGEHLDGVAFGLYAEDDILNTKNEVIVCDRISGWQGRSARGRS